MRVNLVIAGVLGKAEKMMVIVSAGMAIANTKDGYSVNVAWMIGAVAMGFTTEGNAWRLAKV